MKRVSGRSIATAVATDTAADAPAGFASLTLLRQPALTMARKQGMKTKEYRRIQQNMNLCTLLDPPGADKPLARCQGLCNCGAKRRIFGRHLAREERDDLAVLVDDVLAEVPDRQIARTAEEGVDRRLTRALLGHHLLEHRKGDVVGQLAERGDLLRGAGLLSAE